MGWVSEALRSVWASLFGRPWPEWAAGIILGFINVLFVVMALKPFTVYTGLLTWGQTVYGLLGLSWLAGEPRDFILAERTSVGDIGLMLGAMLAAVLAGEARLRVPPLRDAPEYLLGGVLMAAGVALAFGCNWGGFLSALTALSLHGTAMLPGLVVGGFLASRYVEWKAARELERIEILEVEAGRGPPLRGEQGGGSRTLRCLAAAAAVAAAVALVYWAAGGLAATLLLLGVGVGFVIQRSRFCFATAFRDLFGSGDVGRAARIHVGAALALAVGATGVAALKYTGLIDAGVYVKPVGLPNFLGGVLFGFGMGIAGACASGSLWKAAEGHLGAAMALAASVAAYPLMVQYVRAPLVEAGLYSKVFVPDALGWPGALLAIYALSALWALAAILWAWRRGAWRPPSGGGEPW